MMDNQYFIYILTDVQNEVLYVGVTNDLVRRVWEHREGRVPGYTKQRCLRKLVYFESYYDIREAVLREKRMKKWNRVWKIRLIEKENPTWSDLYSRIL